MSGNPSNDREAKLDMFGSMEMPYDLGRRHSDLGVVRPEALQRSSAMGWGAFAKP